ncbi:MAG: AMP-binding protein [Clostridiales bacterium]|nr:AMP-binding protein [Clostridiales bacterium]
MDVMGYHFFQEKIREICEKYKEKTAITYMRKDNSRYKLSFGEIYKKILDFHNIFRQYGLRAGDRIVILTPHSPYGIIAGLAAAYWQFTSVLIDASLPEEEVRRLADDADVRAVLTTKSLLQVFPAERYGTIPICDIEESDFGYPVFERYSRDVKKERTPDPDEDVISILFSSGTTSMMKGIMITYDSVFEARDIFADLAGLTSDMTYLLVLPFNHIAGFTGAMTYFLTGCEIGMIEEVNASKLQKGLLDFQPSYFAMVPKVYEVMEQKIRKAAAEKGKAAEFVFNRGLAFSGFLRKRFGLKIGRKLFAPVLEKVFGKNIFGLGTGAAPCKESTAKFFINMGIEWANLYAATEAGVPIAATGIHDRYPVGTVGNVRRDKRISVRVKNPDEKGIGEIQVYSKMLMKGYFREPELTKEAFDGEYFKTGDYGYIDRKGNLYITGRIKEAILLHNGKKVSPVDIDAVYQKILPENCVAASCGIRKKGQNYDEIWLFVERSELCILTEDEIRNKIQTHSASTGGNYQISHIKFVEKIPVTSVGKVRRYLLKELAKQENTEWEQTEKIHEDETEYRTKDFPEKCKWYHKAVFWVLRKLLSVVWKIEVRGLENIPESGKYILCPNHQSHLDGLWVWSALKNHFPGADKICCMAKQEHLQSRFSHFWMTMLGGVPVNRTGNTLPAIQRCRDSLKTEKNCLLIHPEGTRTRDGKIGNFKKGAAIIALGTGYPIIPVRITGAYDIFPYMRRYPKWMDIARGKRYKLQIEFMKQISPKGETKESLTEKLYQAVAFGKEAERISDSIVESTDILKPTDKDWNLYQIVQNYCPEVEIREDSRLREELGMDSLNMFEMVCILEEHYHISIAEEMEKVITYRDLEELLKNQAGRTEIQNRSLMDYPLPCSEKDRKSLRHLIRMSKLIYDIHVEGTEHIPEGENYLICCNHISYADPIWILAAMPENSLELENICCLAAKHTMEGKFSKRIFKVLGGIPVDREGNTIPVIRRTEELLKDGKNVILFPEGARSRDGSMLPFKPGAGLIAENSGKKILPVKIEGAFEIFPRHIEKPRLYDWKNRRKYQLRIKFGETIDPREKDADEMMHMLRKRIEEM